MTRTLWTTKLRAAAYPALLGLALLALYAYMRGQLEGFRKFLLPSFDEMWRDVFTQPDVLGELALGLFITIQIAAGGLTLSIVFGVLIGVLMFRYRWLERAAFPYLVVLQSIPILAIAPLFQLAFGFGLTPKILIAFLVSFFSIPTTLLLGLKSVDRGMTDLFRLHGASWATTLWKLGLPAALPAFFSGLRIAAGLAVIGAIVGELFFQTGQGGLGQMLIDAKANFEYPKMYAALALSSLLSISIFLLFTALGDRLFAWHGSSARHG